MGIMNTTAKDLTEYGEVKGFAAVRKTDKRASNGSIIWVCQCTTCKHEIEIPEGKFLNGEFGRCLVCLDNEILAL